MDTEYDVKTTHYQNGFKCEPTTNVDRLDNALLQLTYSEMTAFAGYFLANLCLLYKDGMFDDVQVDDVCQTFVNIAREGGPDYGDLGP